MSGVDVQRCEFKKLEKDHLDSKNVLTTDKKPRTIAVELLDDIVENVLDSVLDDEDVMRKVCIVGDRADQYTPRATKLTDLYDAPSDMKDKILTSTEEEVKKLIGEISSPSAKGTGDQLVENEEIVTKKKSLAFSTRNFAVEKKIRLTDLVKNSKSLISRFLTNESKCKDTEWDEHSEEFVKCIELDQIKSEKGENTSEVQHKARHTSSNSSEMIRIPDESGMEDINLIDIKGQSSEQEYEEEMDYVQKYMTFPMASCSKIATAEYERKDSVKDKKKWHLATKIVNYIKKKASKKDIA